MATSATNPRAHLWQRYWAELGPSTLVHKTKAHTTLVQVHAGDTTMWEHLGNAAADRRAKMGAAMHPWSPQASALLDAAWEEALEVASWAGWQDASTLVPPDTVEDISPEERALRRSAEAQRKRCAGTLLVESEEAASGCADSARLLAAALAA